MLEHVRDVWTLRDIETNCTAAIWRNDFWLELRVEHGGELIDSRLSRYGIEPLLLTAGQIKANLASHPRKRRSGGTDEPVAKSFSTDRQSPANGIECSGNQPPKLQIMAVACPATPFSVLDRSCYHRRSSLHLPVHAVAAPPPVAARC